MGWNVHNEKWFKPNKYISYLKLNASYGNPGNRNYDAKLASSIYDYFNDYTNPFGPGSTCKPVGQQRSEMAEDQYL